MNWIKAILPVLPFCVLARAGSLTYSEQTNMSGSLGGTVFTNALITFEVGGTPSAIKSSGDRFWDVFPAGTATVTIAGIPGTATITDIPVVEVFQCTSSCTDPYADFGFVVGNSYFVLLATRNPVFGTYDLTTAIGPVPGTAVGTGLDLNTDKGVLSFSHYDSTTSIFTAASPTAPRTGVPEPASLGLFAGAAALLVAARRRLAR